MEKHYTLLRWSVAFFNLLWPAKSHLLWLNFETNKSKQYRKVIRLHDNQNTLLRCSVTLCDLNLRYHNLCDTEVWGTTNSATNLFFFRRNINGADLFVHKVSFSHVYSFLQILHDDRFGPKYFWLTKLDYLLNNRKPWKQDVTCSLPKAPKYFCLTKLNNYLK